MVLPPAGVGLAVGVGMDELAGGCVGDGDGAAAAVDDAALLLDGVAAGVVAVDEAAVAPVDAEVVGAASGDSPSEHATAASKAAATTAVRIRRTHTPTPSKVDPENLTSRCPGWFARAPVRPPT